MYNAEVPVKTFTLLTREHHSSDFLDGDYWQGTKIKEEHFDTLDEIIHRIYGFGYYTVKEKFYSVGISHGHRVKRNRSISKYYLTEDTIETEEYVTHVILDSWGKNVLKSELLEYATHMTVPRRRYNCRWKGWARGKGGGHRSGYARASIANKKRHEASKDQDWYYTTEDCGSGCEICDFFHEYDGHEDNVRFQRPKFKVRSGADMYEPWYGYYRKGQSTNWKHTRKTQYK